MRRIVAIINRIQSGGAERQLLMLCGGLADRGWDVEIWSLKKPELDDRTLDLMKESEKRGVRFDGRGGGLFSLASKVCRLGKVSKTILWPWGLRSEVVTLMVSLYNRKLAIVGSLRWAMEERIATESRIRKYLGSRIVGYISNTEVSCDLVRKHLPASAEKRFFVVPNIGSRDTSNQIVDLPNEAPEKLEIVMVGHFRTWHKGYDLLPALLRLLDEQNVSVRIRLAGSNDGSGDFLRELAGAEFQERFEYLGLVTDVRDELCASHLYLMMSRAEGMSNSLMEAMQVGLPCISTRVGDVGKVFKDKEHVLVAECEDVNGIAKCIRNACLNWRQTREMASRAREFCSGYIDQNRNEGKADQALRLLFDETFGIQPEPSFLS